MNPGESYRCREPRSASLRVTSGRLKGQAGVGAGGAAVRHAEQVAADLQRPARGVGAPRQIAHRAGQRAGSVQRALRPQQHLHPLDVVQPQVDRERNVAEVGGDAVVVVVADCLRTVQPVGVEAAHDDHVAAARALIDHGQAGRPARQLGQVVDRAPLDVGAGHRRDAHRHLRERLLDAGRGDDGGVLERHEAQDDGRQRHRIAGNRDVVHRHVPEAAQEHGCRVDSGQEAGESKPALRVGLRLPRAAGPAAQGNRCAGQHAPRRVDDRAGDLAGLCRGGRRCGGDAEENQTQASNHETLLRMGRTTLRGAYQTSRSLRDAGAPWSGSEASGCRSCKLHRQR